MDIKTYYADITPLLDNAGLFNRLYGTVSVERKAKIDQLKFQKDKALSLGVAALLDMALKNCGVEKSACKTAYMQNGKPYFLNCDLKFNLSHSGMRVLCAVSDREVGCDVEKIGDNRLKIARRFFNKEEIDYILSRKTTEEQNIAFYKLWTLKESFIKATGTGLLAGLDGFSICFGGDKISVNQGVVSGDFEFFSPEIEPDYKYAVCVKKEKDEKITFLNFEKINFDELF